MQRLISVNLEQHPGYGTDCHSARASALILKACGINDGGEVFILEGGTQTNAVVLDGIMRSWQGVVCSDQAHISIHEAGAIEATGHKVITLPAVNGKLPATSLRKYISDFYRDELWPHTVEPGAVYITQPTELGTLYSKKELEEIADVCHEFDIPLYIDGARLIYGLASGVNDATLPDIARIADVFYIGGTKAGTLFGEAVVLPGKKRIPHFFSQIKRRGALAAKGFIAGLQFETLFEGDLWQRIGRNAIDTAMQLRQGMIDKGYRLFIDSPTNQQFFILPNSVIDSIADKATLEVWGLRGKHDTAVRLVTDWATTPEHIDEFLSLIPDISDQNRS